MQEGEEVYKRVTGWEIQVRREWEVHWKQAKVVAETVNGMKGKLVSFEHCIDFNRVQDVSIRRSSSAVTQN